MKKYGTYRGRRVRLDNPRYLKPGEAGHGRKKFVVYADLGRGKVKRVVFGAPGMRIKRANPKRRASFRARMNCSTSKDKGTARFWACYKW